MPTDPARVRRATRATRRNARCGSSTRSTPTRRDQGTGSSRAARPRHRLPRLQAAADRRDRRRAEAVARARRGLSGRTRSRCTGSSRSAPSGRARWRARRCATCARRWAWRTEQRSDAPRPYVRSFEGPSVPQLVRLWCALRFAPAPRQRSRLRPSSAQLAFGARQQLGDVGAVAPDQQQRHHDDDRDRHRLGAPDQQLVERRERRRDQRGQRRIAEEEGDDQPGRQRRQRQPAG